MIGGMARLGRFFINRGRRRGTSTNLRENVIAVYGGADPWKSRVEYLQPDEAYFVLLDPTGVHPMDAPPGISMRVPLRSSGGR